MSEEPKQVDDDYALTLRLARLCGMPVVDYLDICDVRPRITIDHGRMSLLTTDVTTQPWNPLDDERQVFRFVAKALGRMGLSWSVVQKAGADVILGGGGSARVWRVAERRPGETVDVLELMALVESEDLCRNLCLAALEAAEKLEKRDGNNGPQPPPESPTPKPPPAPPPRLLPSDRVVVLEYVKRESHRAEDEAVELCAVLCGARGCVDCAAAIRRSAL